MDSRPYAQSDGPAAHSEEERRRSLVHAVATSGQQTATENDSRALPEGSVPPIVAAVDGSAASRAAVVEAVRLAAELSAPIVFVYVRRGPAGVFGAPVYQRRLTGKMARARQVLHEALAVADSAGVLAETEVLEGSPRRRISEFARDRDARLIVVGSRRRKLGPSVSTGVIRSAGVPVTVMQSPARLSAPA
jgi:nucleotide-binding universal stress UspA family protein